MFKEYFSSVKNKTCDVWWSICVQNLSKDIRWIEKWPSLDLLKVENGHFLRYFLWFLYFADFRFWPLSAVQKLLFGHFSLSRRKTNIKTCTTPPNPKFLVGPFLDIVTLGDLDLKYAHRKLRTVLRSVPDMIHVVLLIYFHLIRL